MFRKGDKVFIREMKVYDYYHYPMNGKPDMAYTEEMLWLAKQKKVYTVTQAEQVRYGRLYRLDGDDNWYSYTDEFLIPANNLSNDMMKHSLKKEDSHV